MKKEPKVIICMINFNSDDMTLNCLKDLKKVNYKNKEIVVLDNGSKKGSLKQIENAEKKYKFDLIKQRTNTGYAGGANRLIEYILEKKRNFDYVLFLNNDMLFPDKNFLKKMVNKIEKDSLIGIINPLILGKNGNLQNGGAYMDEYLKTGKRIYKNISPKEITKKGYFIDLYCGCSWLVRKDILTKEKIRFKEKYFAYCEDEEFCIKVREKGYKIFVDVFSKVIHLGGASAERMGSGFAIYLITRNEFWLRKEHATKKQMFIYLLNHFFKIFPKRIIYLVLIKRDFKSLRKYFSGLTDGLLKNPQ